MLMLLALTAAPARGQAEPTGLAGFEQLSADTQAVIVLPDLARANRVLGDLTRRYDLPLPQAGDLLSTFKREAQMYGVEDAGAMLIAFTDLDRTLREQARPGVFLLVPVSDYAAFIESYDGDPEAEVTAVHLPQHTGYARRLGDHALLGRTQEAVTDYTPTGDAGTVGERISRYGRRYLGGAAAALYVDVAALRSALDEAIEAVARGETDAAAAVAPPTDTVRAPLRTWLQSVDAAVLALEADDRGLALSATLAYPASSPLAQLVPGDAVDLSDELTRLPDRPYLFALAMDVGALGLGRWLDPANQPGGQQAGQADEAQQLVNERVRPLLERTRATASAYYVPTRQLLMGGNLLNQVSVIRTDDPGRYRSDLKALIGALDGLSVEPTAGGDEAGFGGEATFASRYIDNALDIAGVGVDQFQIAPPSQVRDAFAQTQLGPFAGMLGAQGTTGYITASEDAAGNGYVIVTTQPDIQLVRRTLEAIEQGDGLGGVSTEQLARQQEAQRQARQQARQQAQPQRRDAEAWPEDDYDAMGMDGDMAPPPGRRRGSAMRPMGRMDDADDGPQSIAELRESALPEAAAFEGYLSLAGVGSTLEMVLPMFEAMGVSVPDDLPPVALGVGVADDGIAGRVYLSHRTARFVTELAMHITAMTEGEAASAPRSRNDARRPRR